MIQSKDLKLEKLFKEAIMGLRAIKNIEPNTIIGHRLIRVPFTLQEGVDALKESATSLCAADFIKVWSSLDGLGKGDLILHIKAKKDEAKKLTDWLTEKILSSPREIRAREGLKKEVAIAVSSRKTKELARDIIFALRNDDH